MVGEKDTKGTRTGSVWIGIQTSGASWFEVYTRANRSTNLGDYLINGSAVPGMGSVHVGGAHLLFGDGRVRFISENIDGGTFAALGTINGGEVLGEY